MECVNLRAKFGDRFKVIMEESYAAERGSGARADDPWLQIIPCQHGHIYPYGDDMLVASTAKRGRVARALSELESTTVWRDGDDGMDLLFHVDDFEQVAQRMKPRRRRRLSEQERQRLAEMGRQQLKKRRQGNVQAPSEEAEQPQTSPADPTVAQVSPGAF